MDESSQQAIILGVNLFIFITALTLALTLLLNVRDLAETAYEYDASLPSGSRVVDIEEKKERIVTGYELRSYFANYISNINNPEVYRLEDDNAR